VLRPDRRKMLHLSIVQRREAALIDLLTRLGRGHEGRAALVSRAKRRARDVPAEYRAVRSLADEETVSCRDLQHDKSIVIGELETKSRMGIGVLQ